MKKARDDKLKWYTVSEWIDVETGELLNKSAYERNNYFVIKKSIKNEITEHFGIRKIINECRKSGQTKLFDD